MQNPFKTDAIKAFLALYAPPDLAALYSRSMEVQVTVAKDNGNRIEGDFKGRHWQGYTDGITTWKPIRIPHNAMSEPTWNDSPIAYDLLAHAEGIGMTGWDWVNRNSVWVAFDFDAITGHSDKHRKKMDDIEIARVTELMMAIPWVTVRKSTGGKGRHVYVFLEPTRTDNHTQHAAVARAILSQLSGLARFDFSIKVDICVPRDVWVQTSVGPRQVADLIDRSFNATVNGLNYKSTDRGFWYTGEREVFEIATEEGYKFRATANHPILVRSHFGYTESKRDALYMDMWTEVGHLKSGMEVCLANHQALEWDGDGDFDEGYLLGWLLGDGFLSKNNRNPSETDRAAFGYMTNGLSVFPGDRDLLGFIVSRFKEAPNVRQDTNGEFRVHSRELEALRLKFGLDEHKIIGPCIEMACSDFYKGFISAFFDTDGSANLYEIGIELSQSDLLRLEAVQRMLLRLGIASKIYEDRGPVQMMICGRLCDTKTKYVLRIGRENVRVFNARIGFQHPRKRQKNAAVKTSRVFSEKFTARVRSIVSLGVQSVYDCTIPGPHEFDGNGIRKSNCGGNMWVWHRKLRQAPEGLRLIKAGTELAKVPTNWRDYTPVVSGNRQRNLPWFVEEQRAANEDIESFFDSLTGQRLRVPLDPDHLRLMNWLRENYPNASWWDAEHHMLVTHTYILKEAHETLRFRGTFETNARGTERGHDHNVFGFPISRGGWALRRYALGVEEHPSWEQDGTGWTRCFYNREPDLATASRTHSGMEKPGGGYFFTRAEDAQKVAVILGANCNLSNHVLMQNAVLKIDSKSGKLIFTVMLESGMRGLDNWIVEGKKCTRLFNIRAPGPAEPEVMRLDDQVRHIMTETGEDCGWVVQSEGIWHEEPFQNVKTFLGSLGYKPQEVTNIMGSSIAQCWKLVNKPFEPEYPANREWNRRAAQLRFKPTVDRDGLQYPTWLSVLTHCGTGLNEAVSKDEWCRANGILTGADYLKCWIASLLQAPREPLPYLFFYSEDQNTGKSTFHEALSLLMTNGVERADTALTSQGNFNGELESKVVCVVEESDLRKNVSAYNRIKDWVTSRMLPIHRKGMTPYQVPNTTHWIQCSNSHLYCPVFPGDTRITMCYVGPIDGTVIPKREIVGLLEAEAPDFLAEVLSLEIPPSGDRLNVPVIRTEDKRVNEEANASLLALFISDQCHEAPGHMVMFADFYSRFREWLDPGSAGEWTKIRVGREMPPKFPKGRLTTKNGSVGIGNISFDKIPEAEFRPRYRLSEGWLVGSIPTIVADSNPLAAVQEIVNNEGDCIRTSKASGQGSGGEVRRDGSPDVIG